MSFSKGICIARKSLPSKVIRGVLCRSTFHSLWFVARQKLLEGEAGLSSTNALRQIGLMVGLIASVAIGAAIVLWLWIPGSEDYFGDNIGDYSAAYSATELQTERSQYAIQPRHTENNNRLILLGSDNDSNGKLLTLSGAQLEYTQKLEASYTQRIERLLEPLLGADAIRAQVTADIDFTAREQTLEKYNPDTLVLRNKESEEIVKDHEDGENPGVLNKRRREVKNYEIDKTINHTRSAIGRIDKLSIAVIVDDKLSKGVKGNTIRTPHTEDELKKIADFVKKAVGFNAKRGDIVNVIGASFKTHRFSNRQLQNHVSTTPTWGQVWMKDLFNKTLGTLLVLLLIFAVIRPATKSLISLPASMAENGAQFNSRSDATRTNSGGGLSERNGIGDYERNMDTAVRVVEKDPKLVAQIMKNWVSADGT